MAAQTDDIMPCRLVIEQAAMWQAQLADESCDEEDRLAFTTWLEADPAHRTAFERMGVIAHRAAGQGPVGRTALRRVLSVGARRNGLIALAVGFTGAGLLWWGVQNPAVRTRLADERSEIGEIRDTQLASGDRLTLDSDSAADLDDGARTVRLWRGGIMAQAEHGLPQPLTIVTPQGSVRALGTQFSVRTDGAATIVTVIQSRVEACATQSTRVCLMLEPGQSARLDATGASRLTNVDPAFAAAWAQGMMIADDRPLSSVLDQLNHYRRNPIAYRAADIASIRVTGVFPLMDTDRALASIEAALPVTVERSGKDVTVRRK